MTARKTRDRTPVWLPPAYFQNLRLREQQAAAMLSEDGLSATIPASEANLSILPGLGRLEKARQLAEANARRFPMGKFYDDLVQLSGLANVAGAIDKPYQGLSFRTLRLLARLSIIDRVIINARKAQARRFAQICDVPGKQLGFRVVHRLYQDPSFDSDTDDIRRRCAEMNDLLRRPTKPPHASFSDWLEVAIEDELVIDRRATVLPQNGSGGIVSYHMIDGATVKPRIEALADWMAAQGTSDPERSSLEIQAHLWTNPPTDVRGNKRWVNFMDAAYVQVIDNRIIEAWEEDQIAIGIAHPVNEFNYWGYGRSMLEDSYTLSLLFMQALRFNKNLFDTNWPEGILVLPGEIDDEGADEFRRRYLEYDPADMQRRMPVIGAGAEEFKGQYFKIRDTPREMAFTEMMQMLANLKCAAYRMHPSTINIVPQGQGGAIVSVDNSKGDEISQATEEGFHSLMQGQAWFLTDSVVAPRYDDLIVIVEGLDRENEQAEITSATFDMNVSTFNEIRARRNKKPLPPGLPTDIGDFVMGQQWFNAWQALSQQQQAKQQQDMGSYESGDFGNPQQQGQGQPGQPGQQQPGQPPQPGMQPGQPGAPPPPMPGAPEDGMQQPQGDFGQPPQQQNPLRKSRTVTITEDWPDPWEE